MNKAENDRVRELCALIAEEKDRTRFKELVNELNLLLDAKQQRLDNEAPHDKKTKSS
jgi:hypothetical protein